MRENLPYLYYPSGNKSELLPEWAYFFMGLGYQLAATPKNDCRVVAGLAVPTRVFACSLVAMGVVFARARSENLIDTAQLQYIQNLRADTSVYVRTSNNKRLRGIFKKLVSFNGKQYVLISITKSMERAFPLEEYASRITVADRDVNLPLYQQSGYSLETPSKLLECCLGQELAKTYKLGSSFEALLIGEKSTIAQEVNGVSFSCKISDKFPEVAGDLQEILRVRQFSGANKSYRTQCISSLNITPEKEIGKQTPLVVIFDGAVAYIKLGHKWRSAHQIVLLDRTERQFFDAIELLNQNYAYRLAGVSKLPLKIPNGIELMVYKENIQ